MSLQFPGIEAVVTPITDLFPSLRGRKARAMFVAGYSIFCYCVGLAMITRVNLPTNVDHQVKFYYKH